MPRPSSVNLYSSQLVVLIVSAVSLLALNIYVALETIPLESLLLYVRAFLSLLIVYCATPLLSTKSRQAVRFLLGGWIVLILLNVGLNILNVYALHELPVVSSLCTAAPGACHGAASLFYTLKIFRFITLPSDFFTYPILVSTLLLLNVNLTSFFNSLHFSKKIFLIIISLLTFSNLILSLRSVYISIIHTPQVVEQEYYSRFTIKNGGTAYYGWIRVFSDFILQSTDDTAKMLVPPQSVVYKMEGNINYFRWFMYPRQLVHLEDIQGDYHSQVEYVVISAGECDTRDCVWPDFEIPQEKIESITTIDRETQIKTIYTNVSYVPQNFQQTWGLIKLR